MVDSSHAGDYNAIVSAILVAAAVWLLVKITQGSGGKKAKPVLSKTSSVYGNGSGMKTRALQWAGQWKVWMTLVILISLSGLWWANGWFLPTLSQASVAAWGWANLVWVLIAAGVTFLATYLAPEKTRFGLRWFILCTVLFLLFGIPLLEWVGRKVEGTTGSLQQTATAIPTTHLPMASLPVVEWSKMKLPPNGDSERISVPEGMRVLINGNGFRYHCVYADGTEKSYGAGERPCPYGDMPAVYASNLESYTKILSYAYERIK